MGKIYSFFFILSVPRIACPVIRLKYRDSRQAIFKVSLAKRLSHCHNS